MVEPIMVFTSDDGHEQELTRLYKVTGKRGIKVTHFIVSNRSNQTDFPGTFLDGREIMRMKNRGWDPQCHSQTHQDLRTLTDQQLHDEMQHVDNFFQSAGLPLPKHHAHPLGAYDANVKSIISQYRISQRTTENSTNPLSTLDFQNLKSIRLDGVSELQGCLDGVDIAIANNEVVIIYTHPMKLDTNGLNAVGDLLDYAIEQGIKIMTLSEMYDYVNKN